MSIKLTARQQQSLELLAEGKDPKTIAKEMGVTEHTARGYIKVLREYFNAQTSLQVVIAAQRAGLVQICDCTWGGEDW